MEEEKSEQNDPPGGRLDEDNSSIGVTKERGGGNTDGTLETERPSYVQEVA